MIPDATPLHFPQASHQAGGFVLRFDWQLYPFGAEAFAQEIHERLGLPVDCPRAIEAGTVQRLLNWQSKNLSHLPHE
jgi:hypothetical protein